MPSAAPLHVTSRLAAPIAAPPQAIGRSRQHRASVVSDGNAHGRLRGRIVGVWTPSQNPCQHSTPTPTPFPCAPQPDAGRAQAEPSQLPRSTRCCATARVACGPLSDLAGHGAGRGWDEILIRVCDSRFSPRVTLQLVVSPSRNAGAVRRPCGISYRCRDKSNQARWAPCLPGRVTRGAAARFGDRPWVLALAPTRPAGGRFIVAARCSRR